MGDPDRRRRGRVVRHPEQHRDGVYEPWIAERPLKKSVADHLAAELIQGLKNIEAVRRMLENVEIKTDQDMLIARFICRMFVATIASDRFDALFR